MLLTFLLFTPRIFLASRNDFLTGTSFFSLSVDTRIRLLDDDEGDRRVLLAECFFLRTTLDGVLLFGCNFVALRLVLWLLLDKLSVDARRLLLFLECLLLLEQWSCNACLPPALRSFRLRLLPENVLLDPRELFIDELDDLALGLRFTFAFLPAILLDDDRVDTVLRDALLVLLLILRDFLAEVRLGLAFRLPSDDLFLGLRDDVAARDFLNFAVKELLALLRLCPWPLADDLPLETRCLFTVLACFVRFGDLLVYFGLLLRLRLFVLRLPPDDVLFDARLVLEATLPRLTMLDDLLLERAAFLAPAFRLLSSNGGLRFRARCLFALLLELAELSLEACFLLVLRFLPLSALPEDLLRPRRLLLAV
ncbi:hypothetical protein HPB50_010874 [Hyalomma asiaticum]|uniref:Uncharacterized protein n=1 Tax=Hyalomma asiaticum TaxID=266040 RepID=A0ACB7RKB4_HYAAI|nr:hypothetical protein HPB50_010874 [Hyalomma asiaticum]